MPTSRVQPSRRMQGSKPDTAAHPAPAGAVYPSEEAIAFFNAMRAAFATPPAYLRRALRRAEDFWHPRLDAAPSAAAPSLPTLLRSLRLHLAAADLGVQHHVAAAGDPGAVQFRPRSCECGSLPSRWASSPVELAPSRSLCAIPGLFAVLRIKPRAPQALRVFCCHALVHLMLSACAHLQGRRARRLRHEAPGRQLRGRGRGGVARAGRLAAAATLRLLPRERPH